ncbi:MAG: hypothetical protein L6R42_002830 [Xanthoria sp. 1 TBL-2021]|nr:MAG: hypothetical protein L6R42_002830 [Xanthoria sp. 1 TBL-2021]
MSQFNQTAEQAAQQADICECSICHDTLGPNLAVVVLPGCKHRFHEICIQTWLSPIQLPDMTREPTIFFSGVVDNIFREIEERCNVWETLARHPVPAFARREPVGRLSSGNDIDSDVEELLEAAYDQDEEMSDVSEVRTREVASELLTPPDVANTSAPAEEEEELEEGEIREVQAPQTSQDLQDEELEEGEIREEQRLNQVFTNLLERVLEAGVLLPVTQQPQRRSQDLPEISESFVHADQEQKDRATIIEFLNRRHADNVTLGEREIPLTPSSCRRVFRQARSILRKDAYTYAVGHGLVHGSAEYSRVMRFGTFFEKLRLRDEEIPFFFDANPEFNEFVWGSGFRLMRYQKRLLELLLENNDPRFFRTLRLGLAITPHSYVPFPPQSSSDDEAAWSTDEKDPDLSMSDD